MITCDFCGGPVATTRDLTILPVDRFEVPGMVNFSWGWGACPTCTPLLVAMVEAEDKDAVKAAIEAMSERSLAEHNRRDGGLRSPLVDAVAHMQFNIAYLGLLLHQNGPLRPWEPSLDEREDET